MKRPEGFDPGAAAGTPPPRTPARAKPERAKPERAKPDRAKSTNATPPVGKPVRPTAPARSSAPDPQREPRPARGASRRQPRPDAAARAELRRASRERRRFERAEVRRFTRRARNRRLAFATLAGVLVTLIALVFVAVYSPLLALRTITVDGTNRVDAAEVTKTVDSQLGTPLALIDFGKITEQLGAFPLIRSYVTEIVPPDTLLIHVTERQPVGSVLSGTTYELVDPAGIVLQQSTEPIPGVPLIDLAGKTTADPPFSAMVSVLLALPPEVLAQVAGVSATTKDDVSLVLTGVGQRVTWGSADDSAKKARLLAALIANTDPASAGVFDVSAPGNGVFRPS